MGYISTQEVTEVSTTSDVSVRRPRRRREMLFADDAALTAHTEEALQRLINCFARAFKEFALTISIKKTNVMGQDVSSIPSISIDEHRHTQGFALR